ncbi:MAG: helix-turn-helix domain-containing protein [Gemmataceae bacterium]
MQAELARQCARSAQYSLRAFARFLELDHSTLSQLLRGKRRFTARTIRRCGVKLGLDEGSIVEFTRAEADNQGASDESLIEVRRLATDTAALPVNGIITRSWRSFGFRISDQMCGGSRGCSV